ncbi:MAG: hypothetical protein A2Z25_14405 [Planctomycetes bacterium RBG_16_55_9]|nr:MAG: hypothetical protein A2Z25_14405 [Planctomycetes bacterium RBG_16_55_9]
MSLFPSGTSGMICRGEREYVSEDGSNVIPVKNRKKMRVVRGIDGFYQKNVARTLDRITVVVGPFT